MAGVKGTGGSLMRERAPGSASRGDGRPGEAGRDARHRGRWYPAPAEGCPARGEAVAGAPGGMPGAPRPGAPRPRASPPALCRCSSRGPVVQRSHRADVPHAGLRPGVLRVSGPAPFAKLLLVKIH